jgi:hypothetical protein
MGEKNDEAFERIRPPIRVYIIIIPGGLMMIFIWQISPHNGQRTVLLCCGVCVTMSAQLLGVSVIGTRVPSRRSNTSMPLPPAAAAGLSHTRRFFLPPPKRFVQRRE